MVASYLATARKFTATYEENEENELKAASQGESSFNSFSSYEEQRIHRAKVSALSSPTGVRGVRGDVWAVAIMAGIRYAREGRVNPVAIQEDIEVWKELAAEHGWPPAPPDLITNEDNEFNEERRSA